MAVLFLVLSPRYLGHMMNNPKDIPFASLHIMALYYLSLASVNWPTMRTRHLIMLGISIGPATGVRVGGVVLLCYAMTYIGLLFLANRAAYRQSYRWAISGLGSFVLTAGLSLGASGAAPRAFPCWPCLADTSWQEPVGRSRLETSGRTDSARSWSTSVPTVVSEPLFGPRTKSL
ncbi:MAG: hypothetical protein M5U09_08755 [Gammaproteobacteria bacterium]|nr:hypothetical protein [Gammaproteobacteria bacterium]